MEKQRFNETTACEATRKQFPAFLSGNLKAEVRGRVRGHLLSCRSCALAFSNAVAESMTPELIAKFQRPMPRPPAPVLKALGVWNESEGTVWTTLQSLDTERMPWTEEELSRVRKAFQSALMLWALAQVPKRTHAMRGPTLGPDEEWPSQIDVEIVDSSGQPQGRTVRFEVIEPPTVTPAGEFLLTLRTDEAGVAGWSLRCTITTPEAKVTFAGELQPAADSQCWQVVIKTAGLPASTEPVVIPAEPKLVKLSLQEK